MSEITADRVLIEGPRPRGLSGGENREHGSIVPFRGNVSQSDRYGVVDTSRRDCDDRFTRAMDGPGQSDPAADLSVPLDRPPVSCALRAGHTLRAGENRLALSDHRVRFSQRGAEPLQRVFLPERSHHQRWRLA